MKFCPECGSMLQINPNERIYICPKCGHREPLDEEVSVNREAKKGKEKVIVIGEKERKLSTLPTTKVPCPKCDNDEAYWWMVQTRSADESTTQFYRCTKCGHTWREYS
ncbi:MAG: transcription factor S [Candidatus Bathyarchaeia archaeon]